MLQDKLLIWKLRRGRVDALRQIYDKYKAEMLRLAVRIEIDKGEPGKGHMRVAAYDFEWDVSVEAAEFVPVIPDDYIPGRPLMQIGLKK